MAHLSVFVLFKTASSCAIWLLLEHSKTWSKTLTCTNGLANGAEWIANINGKLWSQFSPVIKYELLMLYEYISRSMVFVRKHDDRWRMNEHFPNLNLQWGWCWMGHLVSPFGLLRISYSTHEWYSVELYFYLNQIYDQNIRTTSHHLPNRF